MQHGDPVLRLIKRVLELAPARKQATDFVTVVYETRDRYAGMSPEEIAYHRNNNHGR